MSVYDTANRLAKEIKSSEEYESYQKIREKILDNDSTKKMLKDYMKLQMKFQSRKMSGEDLSEEEQQELDRLKNLVDINSDVKKYLQSEYQMSQMLNDLQNILFGDLDIGILDQEDLEETQHDDHNHDNHDHDHDH